MRLGTKFHPVDGVECRDQETEYLLREVSHESRWFDCTRRLRPEGIQIHGLNSGPRKARSSHDHSSKSIIISWNSQTKAKDLSLPWRPALLVFDDRLPPRLVSPRLTHCQRPAWTVSPAALLAKCEHATREIDRRPRDPRRPPPLFRPVSARRTATRCQMRTGTPLPPVAPLAIDNNGLILRTPPRRQRDDGRRAGPGRRSGSVHSPALAARTLQSWANL